MRRPRLRSRHRFPGGTGLEGVRLLQKKSLWLSEHAVEGAGTVGERQGGEVRRRKPALNFFQRSLELISRAIIKPCSSAQMNSSNLTTPSLEIWCAGFVKTVAHASHQTGTSRIKAFREDGARAPFCWWSPYRTEAFDLLPSTCTVEWLQNVGGIDGDVINEESSPFPPSLPPFLFIFPLSVGCHVSNWLRLCLFWSRTSQPRRKISWNTWGREGALGVRIRLSWERQHGYLAPVESPSSRLCFSLPVSLTFHSVCRGRFTVIWQIKDEHCNPIPLIQFDGDFCTCNNAGKIR